MNSNAGRNNYGRIQIANRENVDHVFQTPNVKENLLSAKKFGPKQVFGDIKNVIHNQASRTPLKQEVKPSPIMKGNNIRIKSDSTPKVQKIKTVPKKKNVVNSVEYCWAENSIFSWDGYKQKLEKGREIEQKILEDKWNDLEKEITREHEKVPEFDIFNDVMLPYESDLFLPIEVPPLPLPDLSIMQHLPINDNGFKKLWL